MARAAPPLRLLATWALVELALFVALCLAGHDAFWRIVSEPDSEGYVAVARALAHDGTLIPSSRTPGYPLYLAACALVDGSLHLAIALQLVANLAVAVGSWHLVARLVPSSSPRLRAIAASIWFVAGLGMALQLLTDFFAAAYLFTALYGLLFWRSRAGIVASATALGLATLTRPTFTLMPLLLPLVAWCAARVHQKVPRAQLALVAAASLAATGLSVAYQYRTDGYLGPSSVLTFNIEKSLHHALGRGEPFAEWQRRFDARLAARAGVPRAALSRTAAERLARRELTDALRAHPLLVGGDLVLTTVKYLVTPIEALPELVVVRAAGARSLYERVLRPLLFVAWLPLWVLAYVPPRRADRRAWPYYLLAMALLLYVAGLSAIAPIQGERMRFAVLAFLLPLAVARVTRVAQSTAPPSTVAATRTAATG